MPSVLFRKIKLKIKPVWKTAFLSAVIFGFAAHLYRMTNWLPNWDSLVYREDAQHMEPLGRWLLFLASGISSDYELPWLNGLLAVFYISAAAVFICETLGVESRMSALLIGAVTVTFPAVTSTFAYCYVADAYALSFLLACAAVYLLVCRKGLCEAAAAVVLTAVSTGIYQAYITVAIALLTASLIIESVFSGESAAHSVKRALKYAICGIAAFALYYAVNAAVISLSGIGASDYQGISDTLSFGKISFFPALGSAFYSFYKFFITFPNGFNLYSAVNILCFAVIAVGWGCAIIKNVRGASLPLIVFYIMSVPAGCSVLYFANAGLDYHTLMKMSYFTVYIYLIILCERLVFKNGLLNAVKSWTVLFLGAAVVFGNILTANIVYHKLVLSYERSYGILIRISDRIEKLDASGAAEKILVVGALKNSEDYSVNLPPEITGVTDGVILRRDDETVGQSVLTSALRDYCGIDLDFLSGSSARELKNSDAVRNMPCWPADGSVSLIDDAVVVKLSEN